MLKSLLTFFLFIAFFSFCFAQELDTTYWVTNGAVKAIGRSGNRIYLGGDFTQIGPNTGSSALINLTDRQIIKTFPRIKGTVSCAISDGKGGWYIGGNFTSIGGVNKNNLAHLHADYSLDMAWNPIVDGLVTKIHIYNNSLYILGEFTKINGQARRYLAELNINGTLAPLNISVSNGSISDMTFQGSTLYIGGSFTFVNGKLRTKLASIDISTRQLTEWKPVIYSTRSSSDASIFSLEIANNLLYLGGFFSHVDSQPRSNIAAFSLLEHTLSTWNPTLFNSESSIRAVFDLAIANNTVYVTGDFKSIGGQQRNNIGAIDATSGQVTSWNPHVLGDAIRTIIIVGNTAYVGGRFSSVGDLERNNFAAIDLSTGLATDWDPSPNDIVFTIAAFNNTLFVAGGFSTITGVKRKYLAAIDATTKMPTSWNPIVSDEVKTLTISNNLLYITGDFTSVGGQLRNYVAAINLSTGLPTNWNPNPNGKVAALLVAGNNIYVGGDFTGIGGKTRKYVAALDVMNGEPTNWNTQIEGYYVTTLTLLNNTLYAGGHFISIEGQTRKYAVAFDTSTGNVTSWNPNPNAMVNTLYASGNTIYAGGDFTLIGNNVRSYIAALDPLSGEASLWNPSANPTGFVKQITVQDTIVYVIGKFTGIGNQKRRFIAAVDKSTGLATPWVANKDQRSSWGAYEIHTIHLSEDAIYVGGEFVYLHERTISNFAAYVGKSKPVNYIKGNIFIDANKNCIKDSEDSLVVSRAFVKVEPGPFYGLTDEQGNYSIAVDTGTYIVKQIIPANRTDILSQICPANNQTHTVSFKTYNNTAANVNFANEAVLCSKLTVDVTSHARLRCFSNQTIISYQNAGFISEKNVKVYVKFPPYVLPLWASLPFTLGADSTFIFDIGTLKGSQSGTIAFTDSVICGVPSILGLTQCIEAWITPASMCNPADPLWDKSNIDLKASCLENGIVKISIYNKSTGHMADSSQFRIYMDTRLVFMHAYKLASGDSLILQVPANGQTVRIEADQRPYHPIQKTNILTVEACGINKEGKVSKGFFGNLPINSHRLGHDIECMPIVSSLDPNDKGVIPIGVTSAHYTPSGTPLDYKIRFQNTGTATAYKVIVVDTLSTYLDISTLKVNSISHPYRLSVSGKGKPVLTFTFDNINLPDSNQNEPLSHGYIDFTVSPLLTLSQGTVIENYADIFFDFNEPVRTNTVSNTIYDIPVSLLDGSNESKVEICQIAKIAFAGVDRTLCEQDTVMLGASTPGLGKGKWRVVKGSSVVNDVINPISFLSNLSYGENILEWKTAASTCSTDSLVSLVKITRNKRPVVNILSLDTICGQGSLTIQVSGSSKNEYKWYVAQDTSVVIGREATFTTPILSSSTTYYVAAVEEGCEGIRVPVRVIVQDVPTTPIITQVGDSLVCSTIASSYEWYLNGNPLGVNSQKIYPEENGKYTVEVVNGACYSGMSNHYSYEKVTTGVEEQSSQIRVYPNPTSGSVFIELSTGYKAQVSLQDAIGRNVLTKSILNNEKHIEFSLHGIKPGIYVLLIEADKHFWLRKLVIR